MTEIDGVLAAWQPYVEAIDDWQYLVKGLEPIPTGCGPVYELGQPLEDRVPEEFAIADMRDLFLVNLIIMQTVKQKYTLYYLDLER